VDKKKGNASAHEKKRERNCGRKRRPYCTFQLFSDLSCVNVYDRKRIHHFSGSWERE
jgi:hypothetical protein